MSHAQDYHFSIVQPGRLLHRLDPGVQHLGNRHRDFLESPPPSRPWFPRNSLAVNRFAHRSRPPLFRHPLARDLKH